MSPLRYRPKGRGDLAIPTVSVTATEEISVSDKNVNGLTFRRLKPIISPTTAFIVLYLIRLLSAAFATIPDCDEVFNFWEPAHYLSHGYGLQTWEYSPVYAIRSWAYIAIHSILSRGVSLLPQLDKVHEFYGLRCIFALVCAYCETVLYSSISTNINRRVGILFLVTTMTSAGMFHAAAGFLPSTFTMYTTTLGMAAFVDRRRGFQTVKAVFWFALGGFLGWPFSLAMCIPMVSEELFMGMISRNGLSTVFRFVKGGLISLVLLATIVGTDYYAYRKFEIVPLNIVLYNVFGGPGKGPDIYGTEPWWFYLANLSLNFNLLLALALASGPLLILRYLFHSAPPTGLTPRMISISTPFYLWFLIFTSQPHKEERFMFVTYPALCLNAAIAYHVLLSVWGSLSNRVIGGKPKEVLNWTVLILPLIATALASACRILGVVSAYSAPLEIYSGLSSNATGNLCLAKEWYRFPSSYFLPNGVRAKFVKSAFDGLLPGEFPETSDWSRPGTWMIPQGMNDLNIGDDSKYVGLDSCDYFVESYFSNRNAVTLSEGDYPLDKAEWEEVKCTDFLDASTTPTLGRVFWVPKWIPSARSWGRYCLFRRKN